MPIIIMPPQLIIIGMPIAIIAFMALQRSVIMSMSMPSIGIMVQTMPFLPISQVMRVIMAGIIIGMPMPIIGFMPPIIMGLIMPFIIGMPMPIIGFMPPIIMGLIMPFIIGIPMPIGFIMPFMAPIIMGFIMPFIIGMPMPIIGFIMPLIIGFIGIAFMFGIIGIACIGRSLLAALATLEVRAAGWNLRAALRQSNA